MECDSSIDDGELLGGPRRKDKLWVGQLGRPQLI